MKQKQKLILILALLFCLPVLAGAVGPNLLENTGFVLDDNKNPAGWEQAGNGTINIREDAERGRVLQVTLAEGGTASLRQTVPVTPETAYCVRFDARVVDFLGSDGAYMEVPGAPDAVSDKITSSEWQTVEIYGYMSPEMNEVQLAFTIGSFERGDIGTAEFSNIEFFIPDTLPKDETEGKYVNFFDKAAYDAEHDPEEEEKAPNEGSASPSVVIAVLYAVLVLVLNSYGFFNPKPKLDKGKGRGNRQLWLLLGFGLLIRMVAAYTVYGHETDVNDFSIWADHLNNVGITNFYNGEMWCDYPPGYMYVLYVVGALARALGWGVGSPGMVMLIKLPAIICDIATAYLIYRMARNRLGEKIATILAGIYAFNPMVIYDSAFWGQIDSVFTLFVILVFWFYYKNRKELSAAAFMAGLMIKPQMLILGPVVLFAFVKDIIKGDTKKELFALLRAVGAVIVVGLVIILPFSIKQGDALWLLKLMFGTTTQYPFATINAYNFYALIGANWSNYIENGILGISYNTIGNVAIIVVSIAVAIHIYKTDGKRAIFSGGILMIWGIFCFAHSMHERYLFPVIPLAFIAYILYKDKRYLFLMAAASGVLLTNCVVALNDVHLMGFHPTMIMISATNLISFIMCVVVIFSPKKQPQEQAEAALDEGVEMEPHSGMPEFIKITDRRGEKLVRLDYIIMGIVMLAYGIVAFINLGSTEVPQTYWRSKQAGEGVIVKFSQPVELSRAYYYPGVGKGNVSFELGSATGGEAGQQYEVEVKAGEMYTWQDAYIAGTTDTVTVTAQNDGLLINEMVFYDGGNNRVPIQSIEPVDMQGAPIGDVAAMFDEPELVDEQPDYMTEMYFDEIYHARTAFEHLHGFPPYENTHPPLGKIFIMLGIMLFGMNPFGWRVVGTVFGIFMLPIMFIFAKRLFKDTRYATLSLLLFALDGMHFVQTRIATIDVYVVFFIMLMCYYMYRYWQMNFFVDDIKKTFVPLGWCGVMFGLGVASKWIGLYAGAGLAVTLLVSFIMRYVEYRKAKQALADGSETDTDFLKKVVSSYWIKVLQTCLFCIIFFIVIPVAIYLASYLPYFLCAEKPYGFADVWKVQTNDMLGYHSNLKSDHPFQSIWWKWPLIWRPIWYFSGDSVQPGMMSSIAAFGNPAVWWAGLAATLAIGALMIRRDKKLDIGSAVVLMIYLAAALMPWVFIKRAIFIYHYFASVPFIILFTVMLLKRFERKDGRLSRLSFALVAVAAALFVLFYPVWSGVVIDREYALTYIRWFDSWWFFKETK